MFDQADHLRRLIRGAPSARQGGRVQRPQLLVLAGAKGGVGTTTIAVNLAVATARRGRHTLLVDGDLAKADAATLCGLRDRYTIADVLAGRRRIGEASQAGPGGIQVLPGAWAIGLMADCDSAAQERLIVELASLSHVEQVVVDAGCGLHPVLERFWKCADQVLLVSSPESTSVMDAYAALKTLMTRYRDVPVAIVLNQAADLGEAFDAYSRLAAAGRRFLGCELPCLASITRSADIAKAAHLQVPFVLSAPDCPAAQTIEQLATTIHQSTLGRSASEEELALRASRRSLPGENYDSEQTIQAAHA